jgi:hypothetical protein
MRKNLFKCVVEIFTENAKSTNLIYSSILELFDYLTKEFNKKFCTYLVSFSLSSTRSKTMNRYSLRTLSMKGLSGASWLNVKAMKRGRRTRPRGIKTPSKLC